MDQFKSMDAKVRARLRRWPQCPPGMGGAAGHAWLRARPAEGTGTFQPFLKLPGSDRLRTLPDGLWLRFGGTPEEPFADIFAIEACGSMQNLMDKRSRFAPSTQSLLAVCPLPWLLRPVAEEASVPVASPRDATVVGLLVLVLLAASAWFAARVGLTAAPAD